MTTMRIVPAFDELKNGWACFSRGTEAGAVQQFAFEGGEEAFTQGIVKAITDRAHGRADASLPAAATKGKGGVLATMIGMVDDILGVALLDGHGLVSTFGNDPEQFPSFCFLQLDFVLIVCHLSIFSLPYNLIKLRY